MDIQFLPRNKRGNKTWLMSWFTAEHARELLRYDEATGNLYWKERDEKWFRNPDMQWHIKGWNNLYANKLAQRIAYSSKDEHKTYVTSIFDTTVSTHHLVWLIEKGEWPTFIDHLNGDSLDNRIENLREANVTLNNRNAKLQHNNTSGYSGVCFQKNKKNKQWRARGCKNNKIVELGYYQFLEEAVAARKAWEESEGDFTERHGKPRK